MPRVRRTWCQITPRCSWRAADGLLKRLVSWALWWGQIPLRSASDAQPSGVVVAPSLGIHSLSPPRKL